MAKGRDHVIIKVLKTHLKTIPWKIEIEVQVVTGTYTTGLSTECRLRLLLSLLQHPIDVGPST